MLYAYSPCQLDDGDEKGKPDEEHPAVKKPGGRLNQDPADAVEETECQRCKNSIFQSSQAFERAD